jgi:hypothetical protein
MSRVWSGDRCIEPGIRSRVAGAAEGDNRGCILLRAMFSMFLVVLVFPTAVVHAGPRVLGSAGEGGKLGGTG